MRRRFGKNAAPAGKRKRGQESGVNRWIIPPDRRKVTGMEQFFNPAHPEAGFPDLQICIFPHLHEFLVFDSRVGQPQVRSLNVGDVFGDDFFRTVEHEFSHALRELGDYPFDHLMNLTMHFEEAIREVAMMFILDRLGVRMNDHDPPGSEINGSDLPTVVVYVVTGGAVSIQSETVLGALRELLQRPGSNESLPDWERRFADLAAQESEIMQRLNRQELAQAVRGESPDYFALWDNLN